MVGPLYWGKMKKNNPVQSTQKSLSKRKYLSQKSVVRDSSKKKINSYPLYIPNNIDIVELLLLDPINVPNAKDKLYYLMHLIHAVPAFHKDENNELNNGFTILHSRYMQSKVDEYAVLMRWLIKHEIIEVDKGYITEEKSKGFKFKDKYLTEVKKVHITTWTLIRRIIQSNKKSFKSPTLKPQNLYNLSAQEVKNEHLGYSKIAELRLFYLLKWLNNNLTINEESALNFLKDRLTEGLQNPLERFPMHKFNCAKMIVDSLSNPSSRFHVDDTTGRLHTLLTCLKSELRAFLLYNNTPLASIDIKNSQPVLSLVFLDYELFIKNGIKERMDVYYNEINQTSGKSNIYNYIMLRDLIKSNSNKPDLLKYKELVVSGGLYEYFGRKLQELGILNYNIDSKELRSFAKKGLLKSLFNRNQAIGTERIQWAFSKVFPSVYEIFKFIKKKNYKTLACVLQNLEAEIVLHKACKELSDNNPDIVLLTIHDSIATTIDNIDHVKESLSKHLFEALGLPVNLETESWDETLIEKKKNKIINNQIRTISNINCDNTNSPYGYFDYEMLLIHYYSLTEAAKQLGFKRNKFMESLRQLGIINDINIPAIEFEEAKLFLKKEYKLKLRRGKTINMFTTKVTDEGFAFLKQLAEDNPELFPKRKIRVKKL